MLKLSIKKNTLAAAPDTVFGFAAPSAMPSVAPGEPAYIWAHAPAGIPVYMTLGLGDVLHLLFNLLMHLLQHLISLAWTCTSCSSYDHPSTNTGASNTLWMMHSGGWIKHRSYFIISVTFNPPPPPPPAFLDPLESSPAQSSSCTIVLGIGGCGDGDSDGGGCRTQRWYSRRTYDPPHRRHTCATLRCTSRTWRNRLLLWRDVIVQWAHENSGTVAALSVPLFLVRET